MLSGFAAQHTPKAHEDTPFLTVCWLLQRLIYVIILAYTPAVHVQHSKVSGIGRASRLSAFEVQGATMNQPLIHVRNVVKSFRVGDTDITILHKLSFTIQAGEFVSIVGPSGNGKSTLLNMITGIDRPTAGEIMIHGRPIHRMSEDQLAGWRSTEVGIVFQFFQMLPALSLLKNVILPMDFARQYSPRERRERAMDLLALVGLADQADKLPSMVSGGQQQRAAIARALANDPPLLVGDEPTGNLDSQTAQDVFALFEKLVAQGKTILLVTHDKELAQRVPRRLEIVNGCIARDERLHLERATQRPMSAPGIGA
jgi:putative ABC transport system ATP-binding protein